MLYGDIVPIHREGITLSPKALAPIGVFNNSVCWGVWVPDRPPPHREVEVEARPHLLISPLHPAFWSYLLRIELKIRHAPGVMSDTAGVLVRNGINIHFGECTLSGHHHATWNIVGEALSVREVMSRRLREIQEIVARNPNSADIPLFSHDLSEMMFSVGQQLHDSIMAEHEKSEILHRRIVDRIAVLYQLARMRDETRDFAEVQLPQAIGIKWLQNLAYFALYGEHTVRPLQFRYDAEHLLLRADGDSLTEVFLREGFDTRPQLAIASFDTSEHFVRLSPIERPAVSRMLNVSYGYTAEYAGVRKVMESSHNVKELTSLGLWQSVCEDLRPLEFNLVRVSNQTARREGEREAGEIVLVGEVPSVPDEEFIRTVIDKLRTPSSSQRARVKPTVHVSRLKRPKIFISLRRDMPAFQEILAIVEECSNEWGFQPMTSFDEFGSRLGPTVVGKITEADACLQIYSLTSEEQHGQRSASFHPRLKWLYYENGVAIGTGIPVVRIVDIGQRSFDEWKEEIDVGDNDVLQKFNSSESRPDKKVKIEGACKALIGMIASRDLR